jgi:hypothetical protein
MAIAQRPRVPVTAPAQDGVGETDGVVAAIELGDFQADRQDQSWQNFLKRSKAYGAQLEAEGRDI